MIRYLRLYRAFLRYSFRQAIEFKANFWASFFTNCGWMFSMIVFVAVIYRNTKSVAGWSETELLVLIGTYSVVRGLSNTLFYKNLSEIPNYIRLGQMDFILTKPVNSQFYTSLRYVTFDDLGQSLGALFIIMYGWSLGRSGQFGLHKGLSGETIALFALLLVCGLVLFYSMNLLLMTASFWLVRLENLMVLSDTVFGIARTPIDIFKALGPAPAIFLTYIIPLAFLATVPVKALFGRLDAIGYAGEWTWLAISAGISALFFMAATLFWRYATRSYTSASS